MTRPWRLQRRLASRVPYVNERERNTTHNSQSHTRSCTSSGLQVAGVVGQRSAVDVTIFQVAQQFSAMLEGVSAQEIIEEAERIAFGEHES